MDSLFPKYYHADNKDGDCKDFQFLKPTQKIYFYYKEVGTDHLKRVNTKEKLSLLELITISYDIMRKVADRIFIGLSLDSI